MHKYVVLVLLSSLLILSACTKTSSTTGLNRVGLLLEDTIDDQGWNSKGYQGLLNIQTEMKVDVFFKESIDSINKAKGAIEEFDKNNVNLIFGHGRIFADFFSEVKDAYPHIHFVSFNGEVSGENITSLHFDSHAMGFFAGMVAAEMSKSNKIGVIAAFSWQPEVEGFIEGATFHHPSVEVQIEYVNDWSDINKALSIFEQMEEYGVDVYYPAGDGYHIALIEEIKRKGLFSIGFVSDPSDIGGLSVLTSTIQHVDSLYKVVADRFHRGELETGNLYYDFQDGVITLGDYSTVVPSEMQETVNKAIIEYKQTGKLPNR